jgi:formylglycine-generating enzyme required for sulfatase activity
MAERLRPTGFWSYTRDDDRISNGRLSQLRVLLTNELQGLFGKLPQVHIFQDAEAIEHGTDWENEIRKALGQSSFFIPIVTPGFLQSDMCCMEMTRFRDREIELGRSDLIIPFYWIGTEDADPGSREDCCDPAVFDLVRSRQGISFQDLRFREPTSEVVLSRVAELAASIRRTLRRGVPDAPGSSTSTKSTIEPVLPPATSPRPAILSVHRDLPIAPELVLLPEGSFTMGVSFAEEQREKVPEPFRGRSEPQHTVTIPHRFYMGRYPVTRGEYAAFIAENGDRRAGADCWTLAKDKYGEWAWGRKAGLSWRDPGFEQKPDQDRYPVVCVTHEDAEAYVTFLSKKTGLAYYLPSESEWEYAARAVTSVSAPSLARYWGARYWGDGLEPACEYANIADAALARLMGITKPDPEQFFPGEDGFALTSPVGLFRPNDFGLYDMLGNVDEWTKDWWHPHYGDFSPTDGSPLTANGDSAHRVIRGGSWNHPLWSVRAGFRASSGTAARSALTGFRVARTY